MNSRNSKLKVKILRFVSFARNDTEKFVMLMPKLAGSKLGMLTETRTCSRDCPHAKYGVVGAIFRSRSFDSRAFFFASSSLASCAFFNSLRRLSASRLCFRFSFSFRSTFFMRSSSRLSCSRRSARRFSSFAFCAASSSGVDAFALSLSFVFLLYIFSFSGAACSPAPIVSAAFFKPIISPTSTSPFSFFKVVIIFWIICCFSSSARSSSR
mmetsp:Transcript_86745/g.243011  ORF Transcript_86745/g.243011 Transcript_86745/m.243011 type:complete len:211 (-) Transcript_86745:444-1076(-)